jgi:hypothetical protein
MNARVRSDIRLLEDSIQSLVAGREKILQLNRVCVGSNLSFKLTLLAIPRKAVSYVSGSRSLNRCELASRAESLRELLQFGIHANDSPKGLLRRSQWTRLDFLR